MENANKDAQEKSVKKLNCKSIERETDLKNSESQNQKQSYYYDDSHGYQIYQGEEETSDEENRD